MSRDPMAGKYQREAKHEFAMASLVLKDAPGELSWSSNDYEAFRFVSRDVTLIFYPHATSGTGNVSIRVRQQASKKPGRALRLMSLLYIGAGHNTTFSWKHMDLNAVGKVADIGRIEYGWADREARNA